MRTEWISRWDFLIYSSVPNKLTHCSLIFRFFPPPSTSAQNSCHHLREIRFTFRRKFALPIAKKRLDFGPKYRVTVRGKFALTTAQNLSIVCVKFTYRSRKTTMIAVCCKFTSSLVENLRHCLREKYFEVFKNLRHYSRKIFSDIAPNFKSSLVENSSHRLQKTCATVRGKFALLFAKKTLQLMAKNLRHCPSTQNSRRLLQ